MAESTISGLWFYPEQNDASRDTPLPTDVRLADDLAPQSKEATVPTEQVRILIWQNEIRDARQIEQNLQIAGYTRTFCATSYTEGLTYLDKLLFDVLLIDLNLGEFGGLRLVQALRDSNTYRHTPVLMTTNMHRVEDMLSSMKAGANDLIASPFTPELLDQKIGLYLKISSFE